jgi:hypothetical protein
MIWVIEYHSCLLIDRRWILSGDASNNHTVLNPAHKVFDAEWLIRPKFSNSIVQKCTQHLNLKLFVLKKIEQEFKFNE